MKSATDTSSISFTAHYTGYVWFKHHLSEPAFVTPQGQLYYSLLRPFEFLARRLIGTDIKTTLLQRHHLIDRELTRLIAANPHLQVLEIACGLSPRGHRFAQEYPNISYVEADLPGMVRRKQGLLEKLFSLNDRHRIVVCNILDQGATSLENVIDREFDPTRPLVVITEGLVNYFDLPTITGFWQRLVTQLQAFPLGIYLTDLYPSVQNRHFSGLIRTANESLRVASRSGFCLHFDSDDEIRRHFSAQGFADVTVLNPDTEIKDSKVPSASGGSIVRVIGSSVQKASH
jgi:O-methyltransferase involved in polyketide biosynthesis